MFETATLTITKVALPEGFFMEIFEEENLYKLWIGSAHNAFKIVAWNESKPQSIDEVINKIKIDPERVQNIIQEYKKEI